MIYTIMIVRGKISESQCLSQELESGCQKLGVIRRNFEDYGFQMTLRSSAGLDYAERLINA